MEHLNTTNTTIFEGCDLTSESPVSRGFKILGYVLIAILALVGNVLVICVVLRSPRMRTVTNYFIANVSIADLLTAVFNMVPTLYWVITGRDAWSIGGEIGQLLCKLLNYLQLVSIACSVFSMAAIAFDRVFSIYRPLKRTITFPRAKVIIGLIWLSSCLISSPNLYTLGLHVIDGVELCFEKWGPLFDEATSPLNYTIALFALLYAVPLVLIAFLYTIVIVRLWNRRTPGQHSATNRTNRERANRRVLKMLITVVVVFAVCWLPLYVRMFLMFSYPTRYICGLPYHLDFITLYLGHANSSVNPYIYAVFNEKFRQGFLSIVWNNRASWSDRYSSTRLGSTHRESGKLLKQSKKQPSNASDVVSPSKSVLEKDIPTAV